jgi:ACS family hexuronate transporter-like MFS transporter
MLKTSVNGSDSTRRVRLRWWICGLLLIATIISYIDRQAMSMAAPVLAAEFHFSNTDIATIINAFLIAYMVGQPMAGRFIDWVGPRLGFAILVTSWSLAVALTSLGGSVVGFSAFRAALGLAEGVNFPGGVKVVAEWFPPVERATAVGLFTSGASIGAIIAPPLFAYVIVALGWQIAFLIVALPGLLWVVFWSRIYRPPGTVVPRTIHGTTQLVVVPPAALTARPETRTAWTYLLRQRLIWGVFLARFCEEPVSWFYLTWLPVYMRVYRDLSIMDIGVALIFPFVALDIGYLAGGWSSSRLMRHGWTVNKARKTVMVLSAICMVSGVPAATAKSTAGFVAWVSLAMMGHGGWGSNIFTLPSDFAPAKSVGTAYGITAFGGSLGAILCTQIIGVVTDAQHSFRAVFVMAGLLPILAALVLLTVPGKFAEIRQPDAATEM